MHDLQVGGDTLIFAKEESAGKGKIEAMVAIYGPRDLPDGRKLFWTSGMFAGYVEKFNMGDRPLPMFYNHASTDKLPLGQWTKFEDAEDGTGLMGYGEIFTNTSEGRDVYTILKESPNLLHGVSIGVGGTGLRMVNALGEELAKDNKAGYWQIDGAFLKEVSITKDSADPDAEIKELFHADGAVNISIVEKRLRDAGLPRALAKQGCAAFKGLKLRDAAPIFETKVALPARDVQTELAKVAQTVELLRLSKTLSKGIKHV